MVKKDLIIRKFDGERYRFDSWHNFKSDAVKRRKQLKGMKSIKNVSRRKKARIVPHVKLGKWIVYVRD